MVYRAAMRKTPFNYEVWLLSHQLGTLAPLMRPHSSAARCVPLWRSPSLSRICPLNVLKQEISVLVPAVLTEAK